jgi:hypothetical protein
MGLDITAHEKLAFIPVESEEQLERLQHDYEYGENGVMKIYVNPDFPAQADNLADGGFYRTEGESWAFRAGAYSAYNRWREDLAKLVGTTPERVWEGKRPGPFVELINFSDCEGVIGSDTSAKLARDFQEYAERALDHNAEQGWLQVYKHFRKAFEMAAKGGCVRFH